MLGQVVNTLIGLWIMASPAILAFSDPAATDNNHIIGPVVVTFAIIAYWEATRKVGLWNLPFGVWLILSPWVLSFNDTTAIVNNMIAGLLVIIFSLVRGKIKQRFGGGWSALFQKNPDHQKYVDKVPYKG